MADKEKDKEIITNLTKQDFQDIITGAATAAAIAARAPSAEEEAEKAAERDRRKRRAALMQALVRTQKASELKRRQMCRHKKPDGEEASGGQAFSDGMNRKICLRCQELMVEEPTPEFEIAKNELQRLIDSGKVKVRPDGTIEVYENRILPERQRGRDFEAQELEG